MSQNGNAEVIPFLLNSVNLEAFESPSRIHDVIEGSGGGTRVSSSLETCPLIKCVNGSDSQDAKSREIPTKKDQGYISSKQAVCSLKENFFKTVSLVYRRKLWILGMINIGEYTFWIAASPHNRLKNPRKPRLTFMWAKLCIWRTSLGRTSSDMEGKTSSEGCRFYHHHHRMNEWLKFPFREQMFDEFFVSQLFLQLQLILFAENSSQNIDTNISRTRNDDDDDDERCCSDTEWEVQPK